MSIRAALAVLLLAATVIAQSAPLPSAISQAEPAPAAGIPEGLTTSDWSSITAAYQAGRHMVQSVNGSYSARNPGQQWTTLFDGRGFTTTPDVGGWSWGLELASYGWLGNERAVVAPQAVTADGQRIAYAWSDVLTEWYVNDAHGLEHGYTVHARPAEAGGNLALDLAIRGDLDAAVSGDGRDVRFVGAAGHTIMTYTGLAVFDADGCALAARFETTESGLRLSVNDENASYPLMIDPVAQQAYLKASNTGATDVFGFSVSVSGDTVVVGAPNEDSNATGVDGDQSDNGMPNSGAAYVFVRSGTTWSQRAYLKASNTGTADAFGISVAVSGDTVVIGAPRESSNATGVNGDESDNSKWSSGAAYVFVRNGTSWTQQAYCKASRNDLGDSFGHSVAITGDTVVVGAIGEDSNATGVNGNQVNNLANDSGAAYVFVRIGTTWNQEAYIKASNTDEQDAFGGAVATSDDIIVIGTDSEDSSATGVDGDQLDNSAPRSGAAYVFVRNGTAWSQEAYLKASNAQQNDWFGGSVGVSGDTVVVGAIGEDSDATGVDGDQSDNSLSKPGAAYVFVRSGATWSQQAYLKGSVTPTIEFGAGVAVSGDTVVVGAQVYPGVVYAFSRCTATWSPHGEFGASDSGSTPWAPDLFGTSVSISGDTVVVGAKREASKATGVDGDGDDTSAAGAGAAYAFDLRSAGWDDLGCALIGVSGNPLLIGTGTLQSASPGSLDLTAAAPAATALLFVSLASSPTPFKGGTLKPLPSILELPSVTDGIGAITLPFLWPTGIPPDTELYFQWAIQDAAAINGVALSNALLGVTP